MTDVITASVGQRITKRQQEQTHRAIDEAVRRIAPIIDAALNAVAEKFTATVLADGEPIHDGDTRPIEEYWAAETPTIANALTHVYTGTTNLVMQTLGGQRSLTEGLREQYLTSAANRLGDVGADLWHETRNTLAEGNLAGESYDQLRTRLQDTFKAGGTELGETRAVRIARTEVQSAVNRGTLDGVKAMGPGVRPLYKTWVATADAATRESHAEADGQTVDIDGAFEVDGENMEYPGDPSGSPGNVIQCRCTTVYGNNPDGPQSEDDATTFDYCGDCSDEPSDLTAGGLSREDYDYVQGKLERGEELSPSVAKAWSEFDGTITDEPNANESSSPDEVTPSCCTIMDDPALQAVNDTFSQNFLNDLEGSKSWVSENFSDWEGGLAQDQTNAIVDYTQNGFDINVMLRAGDAVDIEQLEYGMAGATLADLQATVNGLDSALADSVVPEDITVHRLLTDPEGEGWWNSWQPGDIISDDAFISTSLSSDTFMDTSIANAKATITVPAGSHGAPIANIGIAQDALGNNPLIERVDEFLLPRGSSFRVKSIAPDGSFYLELIP